MTTTAPFPWVDEHSVCIPGSRVVVWELLQRHVEGAVLLRSHRAFPIRTAVPNASLILRGAHRFASYELVFLLGEHAGMTVVTAQTSALFPGRAGWAYHALVIRSGAHAWVVRRFLAGLAAARVGTRPPAS